VGGAGRGGGGRWGRGREAGDVWFGTGLVGWEKLSISLYLLVRVVEGVDAAAVGRLGTSCGGRTWAVVSVAGGSAVMVAGRLSWALLWPPPTDGSWL